LADAYEKVPHYRECMKKVNYRPNDVKSLEDARKVPILKKSEIRDGLSKMVAMVDRAYEFAIQNFSKERLCRRYVKS
jgi:phenylacetate-CoA ligase